MELARLPRRRAPDERRDQLLDAAEQVLTERGLASATVADVAKAAGVAKGTVYLYFTSKDALLAGLRARSLARLADTVDPASMPIEMPHAERLTCFVKGLFAWGVANAELHQLLFHEAGFTEDQAFGEARRVLSSLVSDGVAAGAFTDVDPAIAADFVMHGLHGLLVGALRGPARARPAAVSAASALAARAVGAPT